MNQAIASVLFCVILCFCYASCVNFWSCGSTLGRFTDVSVIGCSTKDKRCIFIPGATIVVFIKFIPDVDIPQVYARARAVKEEGDVHFVFDESDVCKDPYSLVQCPLQKDQEYNYTEMFILDPNTLDYSITLEWELVNAAGEKIVCVGIPADLRNATRSD
ncbi:PREDICTED: protein NPC2 homolog [Dinoponera quadriceps]|uniref:Protein NPC2 homolog n=1 Tax=Dinoponera quadriceps TaxID=609295 RepID=A0A6P3Y591_DINQU|nr:PREDICTED: protein NPC2 homolog [Dinoponera quadriceps]